MQINFLGHASFIITTNKGVRIITDPYKSGCYNNALRYKPINESADIVLISHDHDDHNCISEVLGNPKIIQGEGTGVEKGIKFTGISVYHDTQKGSARGKNIIFVIEADDLRIAHLGDLGHTLSKAESDKLGTIDILLIPVGGFFTIDSNAATEIMNRLNPRITIPMHYKTPSIDFPIVAVDEFIKDKKNVRKFDKSEIVISKESLPTTPEIWVLLMAKTK